MAGPSAQYVIDIAAQMSGLDPTVAGLNELQSQLAGIGKDSAAFTDAISDLGVQLDGAKAASAAANAALAAGATEYRQLERAADMLAKKAERAALKNAGIIPADLKAKADAAALAVNQFATKLGKLEDEAQAATAAERALGKQLADVKVLQGHVNKTFAKSSEDVAKLQSGLSAVGGPLGVLGQKAAMPIKAFADLRQVVGATRAGMIVAAVGVAALVAAVVALTAAMVAGVVAAAAYAIKLGDTRRAAGLAREAFDALNPTLAGLDFAGLTRDTGVADDRLRALSKTLRDAKVSAGDLPAALRAAALAEAALGQGGADAFIADMKAGKLTVQEFAATAEQKLGGIVSRQMLGLEAQGARFRSNISSLFGGLNIEPALRGLRTLVKLFDENEVAGKAVKFLFSKIFQPLIDNAQNAAYVVEAFALGFLIGLTKLYISLKPYFGAIADFFGFNDTSLSDTLRSAKNAGELVAKAFAYGSVVFGVFAVALGAIVVVVGIVAVLFAALVAVVFAVGFAVGWLAAIIVDTLIAAWVWLSDTMTSLAIAAADATVDALIGLWDTLKAVGQGIVDFVIGAIEWFGSLPGKALAALQALGSLLLGLFQQAWALVTGWLSGVSLADLGMQLIQGLASGITAGVGAVVSAVKNAVGGAIKAAKSALGIASPSKVFANIGINTAEGFAGGVDDGSDTAGEAMQALVAPPVTRAVDVPVPALARPQAATQGPAATGGAGAAKAVDLHGATFNFYGVEGADDAEARFGELLTRAVEGDAAALGAAQGAPA